MPAGNKDVFTCGAVRGVGRRNAGSRELSLRLPEGGPVVSCQGGSNLGAFQVLNVSQGVAGDDAGDTLRVKPWCLIYVVVIAGCA